MTTIALTALIIYIVVKAFYVALDMLNVRYMAKNSNHIPLEIESAIEGYFTARGAEYSSERAVLHIVTSALGAIIVIWFLYFGGLAAFDRFLSGFNLGFTARGVIFFLAINLAQSIISMPVSLYSTFKIEAKYGFNKMSFGMWCVDMLKSTAISSVLIAVAAAIGLYIVTWSPGAWWFWIWLFLLILGLLIFYISPYIIEPIFNRYDEITDPVTSEAIRSVMQKAGLNIYKVLKVDGSKRSTHLNAYFTGIGKNKRIVVFDTLLEKLSLDELSGVIAHEAGHNKLMHLFISIIYFEAYSFALLFIAHDVMNTHHLIAATGIEGLSFYSQAIMLAFYFSVALFPLGMLSRYSSRIRERRADAFAAKVTGKPDSLADALLKLYASNLGSPCVHPLYAAINYTHPPLTERLKHLQAMKHKGSRPTRP